MLGYQVIRNAFSNKIEIRNTISVCRLKVEIKSRDSQSQFEVHIRKTNVKLAGQPDQPDN